MQAYRGKGIMKSVADISVLIVDSSLGMRGSLRNMLSMCEIHNITNAPSAAAAMRKLRGARYDLILCEYHLGDGQDGQHFLEDIRQHRLVPLSTVFIMVTGEAGYDKVVSAAELAPNDYILKPFTGDLLLERIVRAMAKRDAFRPAYQLVEIGNYFDALDYLAAAEAKFRPYALDLMRLRAEIQLAVGNPVESQRIYQQVLDIKSVPWARLGLAKSLYLQKQYLEAEPILEGLVAESQLYLDAYDWLAKTREAIGKTEEATVTVREAVDLSPHTVRRLRKLGELTLESGDLETAEKMLAKVVHKGKYSDFRDPEDHVRLMQVVLGKGEPDRAQTVIWDMERSMRGHTKTPACSAISTAFLHSNGKDKHLARDALDNAVRASQAVPGLSSGIRTDLVRECLNFQMDEQAVVVLSDVMRNASDEQTMARVRQMLDKAGKAQLAETVARQAGSETDEIMREGAQRAASGDLAGAVGLMLEAVRRMPGNPRMMMNAALAILKHIDTLGWSESLASQAHGFITRARLIDPGNDRLAAISNFHYAMLKKYGVRPDRL